MKRWIICYDISDDRERRRVAKYLESVAERAQYSVFELVCRDNKLVEDVQKKLTELVLDPSDIRFYPITQQALEDCRTLDGKPLLQRPSAVIIV